MNRLIVNIEKKGALIPVGTITGTDPSDACFQYSEEYRKDAEAVPISISLPIQSDPFPAGRTSAFFEGLLPEGFTRRTVAQWMHVDEGDYLSILYCLGRECLGALCITKDDEQTGASYEPVSDEQVRELAAEGASKSAEMLAKAHLSLTGASGKVGLYYDSMNSTWYLPKGTAPSTHIVKQSHVRLNAVVTNERLSLMTAKRCGLDVPDVFTVNTGHGADHEVLFASQRYDRMFAPGCPVVSGLKRPFRLHQEDFAQAMGISAASKYENNGDGYMKRMFEILRTRSANPVADQLKLWDAIIFDFLIGNTDAHIKNFSLLYGKNLQQIRLAPVYDIISTAVYEQSTRNMAFRIGGSLSLDELSRDAFRLAAEEVGLGRKMAMRRFDSMTGLFPSALHESAKELVQEGYPAAAELEDRIIQTAGIKNC